MPAPSQKKPGAAPLQPERPEAAGANAGRAFAVPRAWLVALIAAVILPWLVVAGFYVWSAVEIVEHVAPGADEPGLAADPGPWGDLTLTPVIVSPPLEFVSTASAASRRASPTWHFPGVSVELARTFLTSTGLASDQVSAILSTAQPDPRTGGFTIRPDLALVRGLDPATRGRIYLQLARSLLNAEQAHSFRFRGDSAADWLGASLISADTRALVEPLIYRDGEFLHFADLSLIRPLIPDEEELRRLIKTLHRQATVLVTLDVDSVEEVIDLADYWGRGGRRTDLIPLLESVVGAGPDRAIDITHLLPAFAREHLYRYPRITAADLDQPVIANCLWTALNFFNGEPDDRYLDVDYALKSLREDYYVVESGFQLGDIIAFLDEDGDLFHVAVYLADDLAFSKNGTSPMAPWSIMSIEALQGYYRVRAKEQELIVHRRNGL